VLSGVFLVPVSPELFFQLPSPHHALVAQMFCTTTSTNTDKFLVPITKKNVKELQKLFAVTKKKEHKLCHLLT